MSYFGLTCKGVQEKKCLVLLIEISLRLVIRNKQALLHSVDGSREV